MDKRELVAVLAHEAGHQKYRHSLVRVLALIMLATIFWLLNQVVNPGAQAPYFYLATILVESLVSTVTVCAVCRRQELAADTFAAQHSLGPAIVSFLHKARADWVARGYIFSAVELLSAYPRHDVRLTILRKKL